MRKALGFSLIAVFILIALIAFAVPFHTPAEAYAAFTGEIAVNKDDDGFYYNYNSVDDDIRYDTLQGLITYLETTQNASDNPSGNLRLVFNDITSTSRITLSGSYVMTGVLTFDIPAYDSNNNYAITVNAYKSLTLNAELHSVGQSFGIFLNREATLVTNGSIDVNSPISNGCAIFINGGSANVGGSVKYRSATNTGCGIYLGSGSATLSPALVEAPTSVFANNGTLTVNGGRYDSTVANPGNEFGYSVLVNNSAAVELNGGTYNAPILYSSTSTASLSINGGAYNSALDLAKTTSFNGSVKVKDLNVTPSQYCEVRVILNALSSDKITFGSVAGTANDHGYSARQYVIDEIQYDLDTQLDLTANAFKTVAFFADNHYYLSVYVGDERQIYESYEYGTVIQCADLAVTIPAGYSLQKWRVNTGDVTYVTINEDIRVDARLVLEPCVVTYTQNEYSFTYNGLAHSVTANVAHGFGDNVDDRPEVFYYQWQKKSGNNYVNVDGATARTLNLTDVADSGTYRFYVDVTDGEKWASTAFGGDITVTIDKGAYDANGIDKPSFSGTYSKNMTLDAAFPFANPAFTWKAGGTIVVCNVTSYPAIYNADPANYYPCELNISVTLAKADPVPTAPNPAPAVQYAANLTLTDINLPTGYAWADETTPLQMGAQDCSAVYNPDPNNYNDYELSLAVTVNKADYTGITFSPLPSHRYAENFYSLSHLDDYIRSARPGWRLVYTENASLEMGAHAYVCAYNADSVHYNDFETNIEFSLDKGIIGGNWAHEAVSVPFGDALGTVALESNFRWADPTTVPLFSGAYPAYYNYDTVHYEDYELTVAVTVIKADYTDSDVPPHEIDPIVYSPTRTLADVALPDNFVWADATVVPTVAVTKYAARYCADVNHNPYDLYIDLTVTRASLQAPVFADTTVVYDGQEHELTATNIDPLVTITGYKDNKRTEAGTTDAQAFVTQSDRDNYILLPDTLHATLTIAKAPSIITAPSRVDVKVGGQLNISATVNNAEQSVVVPAVDTSRSGIYEITLRTEESGNYLAGSLVITVFVDPDEAMVGQIAYPDDYAYDEFFGMITAEDGVPVDAEVKFLPTDNKDGVTISVGTGSDELYTVKLLIPENMRKSDFTLTKDGEVIDYRIESGVYLVFKAKDGDTVYFNAVNKPFVWYWIPPVAAVVIAGAVLLILYKKKVLFNRPKKVESTDVPEETDEK